MFFYLNDTHVHNPKKILCKMVFYKMCKIADNAYYTNLIYTHEW